ncbi:hypothetical protein BGW41_000267 [Actinomortierella wolfii]|nr:hypothetical protein BGW41_000267 [Actinomortierella wolfii]
MKSSMNRTAVVGIALAISALLMLVTFQHSAPSPRTFQPTSRGGKPRFIFVDLGANRADSMDVFLKRPGTKFNYDYPKPDWARYEDAEIFLFEANPVFNGALVKAKQRADEEGIKVEIFPSTVVDVKDGIRTFFLDTVNDSHDYWGSSIYASHPDAIKSKSKGTDLTGINIATWLLRNTLPRDFVVVKMDIEGAEYEVVPHLAEMQAGAVIDHLLIEWHGIDVTGVTDPEQARLIDERTKAAIARLEQMGVNMPKYDSAA